MKGHANESVNEANKSLQEKIDKLNLIRKV